MNLDRYTAYEAALWLMLASLVLALAYQVAENYRLDTEWVRACKASPKHYYVCEGLQ